MLLPRTRSQFSTLLDSLTLHQNGPPAIIYMATDQETITISRAEFRRNIFRYATALQAMGVGNRDLVIIAHTQNLESIYAFWAAMLVGAIPSMFPTLTEKLDPAVYMHSMAELTRLSQVRAVFTTDDFAPLLAEQVSCPVYGSSRLKAAIKATDIARFTPHQPRPEEIAFLQHSSGTTGLQKGVALSHQAVLNQITAYSAEIALSEDDVVVSWLPLYHDMGLIAGFILPLVQGIPLVLMSPFDWVRHPALLLRAIHEHRGTLCWLPNFAYNHLARRVRRRDAAPWSLSSMRLFINCSEPVRWDSHQLFMDRFQNQGLRPEMLGASYAMAENTFAVTQTFPGQVPTVDWVDRSLLEKERIARPVPPDHPQAVAKVSCGLPIDGTEVQVVDGQGQVLPPRSIGELTIRSDCMLTEYYRRPDLDPFQDGWFRTGDMGYIAGREVYVNGRSKDLIINAGKNIYPQDIEAIINEVPGVRPGRAVVFGVPDRREGTELVAVVAEVDTDDPAERQTINKAIRQEVSRRSMVTVSYVHLVNDQWLLKTSSGKIARAANRDKWLAEKAIAKDTL
jgi:acyl-CoA synthetase (AMP-forming)/AMP-acid ligase II